MAGRKQKGSSVISPSGTMRTTYGDLFNRKTTYEDFFNERIAYGSLFNWKTTYEDFFNILRG